MLRTYVSQPLPLLLCVPCLLASAAGAGAVTILEVEGGAQFDYVGVSVAPAGDVNGDGHGDVIVGAWGDDTAGDTAGRAFVYFGGPGADDVADLVLTGESTGDTFGFSVSSAGDMNGDGYDDVIVGAWGNDAGAMEGGRAYVFFGGPGLDSVADVTLTGFSVNGRFGHSVAAAGDVNGDTYGDVIVGAPLAGASGTATIFYGGAVPDDMADITFNGPETGSQFGFSVSSAGDVNGDGYDDALIGAPRRDLVANDAGSALIYLLGPLLDLTPDFTFSGEASGDIFGTSVSSAGDVNGDGYGDVIVGAPHSDGVVGNNSGRAYLFYCGPAVDIDPDLFFNGEGLNDEFGFAVSSAGDVDGDGTDDLVVGAWVYGSGTSPNAGRAYVFRGGPGVDAVPEFVLTGDDGYDDLGYSVASAGDFDGDGLDDVIVGARRAGGAQAGKAYVIAPVPYRVTSPNGGEQLVVGSTSTARWLGHELADLAISRDGGASWTTVASRVGGSDDNELAFIVPGPPTGHALLRVVRAGQGAIQANSDLSDAVFAIVEAVSPPAAVHPRVLTYTGEAGDLAGFSVSGVGDFSGDGVDDFVITALGGDEAWVFHGGADLDSVPDLTLAGEVAGDQYGQAASGGGDFNGDGYADLIVSARSNDAGGSEAGRAYVYYGGPGADDVADVTFTGEAPSDFFGTDVAMDGDLNGDGFADAVVGAPNAGPGNVGQAYVFFGGATPDDIPDATFPGTQAGASFSSNVAIVGDVNGDGFDDFAISETGNDAAGENAGSIHVHFGGTTIDAVADWVLRGEAAGDALGIDLAGAGDVNGDGFADVVATSTASDGTFENAGAAFVFHGGPSPDPHADWVIRGEGPNAFLGHSCAGGDLNGDGYDDVVVGAQLYAGNVGRVFVYYGGPGADGVADAYMDGEYANDIFGDAVAIVGDTNQDGYDEILVGARLNDTGGGVSGRAYLHDSQRYLLTAPTADDTWHVGGTESITWVGSEPADLWLSVDAGASFDLLRADVGGDVDNLELVQVPNLPTRFAVLEVRPSGPNVAGAARSDSLFTIESMIALLRFEVSPGTDGGADLEWRTDPVVGADGIAGYRLYRLAPGAAGLGDPIGPDLITATSYTDPDGTLGSSYRLTAVNGLGDELELGRRLLPARRALAAWPIPYRGGTLRVFFAASSALGGGPGYTELAVYDAGGRRVRSLVQAHVTPGHHSTTWDGRDESRRAVPAGVYFLRLESEARARHLKLVVLR